MRTGIALGSNQGDRLRHLRDAIAFIRTLAVPDSPLAVSHAYETEPINCPPGSLLFLNAAAEMEFAGTPLELLAQLQRYEVEAGRPKRHPKNTPRSIDLDILYCDNAVLAHPFLTVPHPRIAERFFVLKPLSEICPDRKIPGQNQTVAELLGELDIKNAKIYNIF